MKKNTGSKKVLRAIALALATVVTVTSVPVTTLADDNAGKTQIVVEDLTMNFTNDNLSDASKAAVAEAKNVDQKSDDAAKLADTAAEKAAAAAEFANTAAGHAATAENNATDAAAIAAAAEALSTALAENTQLAADIATVADTEDIADIQQAIDTAKTDVANANQAIQDAEDAKQDVEDAITGENGANAKVAAANAQQVVADNKTHEANLAKGVRNDKNPSKSTGTQALIQAAESELAGIEADETQLNSDKSDLKKELKDVKKKVEKVEELYEKADQDAKKEIDRIAGELKSAVVDTDIAGAAATAANSAEEAKKNAASAEGNASSAYSDTWNNWYAVQQLVALGSNDVDAAFAYANKAAESAAKAQNAANSAAAYAEVAATAQSTANAKYEAAKAAYEKALSDLQAAEEDYKKDYKKANRKANKADAAVDTVNGKVNDFNDEVKDLKKDVKNYNNTTVTNVNGSIEATNQKIQDAQDAIDEYNRLKGLADTAIDAIDNETNGLKKQAQDLVDTANELIGEAPTEGVEGSGSGAKKSIADATSQKSAQLQAIADALEELEDAKAVYDAAVEGKALSDAQAEAAATAATNAATAAANAKTNYDSILSQAAQANALSLLNGANGAPQASKDALAKVNNDGKTYAQLVQEKADAEGAYTSTMNGIYEKYPISGDQDPAKAVKYLNDQKDALIGNKTIGEKRYTKKGFWGAVGGVFVQYDYKYVLEHRGDFKADTITDAENERDAAALVADIDRINTAVDTKSKTTNAVAGVDDYVYTNDNLLVIDPATEELLLNNYDALVAQLETFAGAGADDLDQYKTILASLRTSYDSYHDADADTTNWKENYTKPTIIGTDKWKKEIALENKYGTEWYNMIFWFTDGSTTEKMEATTSNRCTTFVCPDIDKLAVLRSTFAAVKYEAANQVAQAAQAKAEKAKEDAATASQNCADALEKRTAALNRYNALKAQLVGVDGNGGAPAELSGEDDVIPALTADSVADGQYTAIDTINDLQKSLRVKYGKKAKLTEHEYAGPSKIKEKNKASKVVRGEKDAFIGSISDEDLKGLELSEEMLAEMSPIDILRLIVEKAAGELAKAEEAKKKADAEKELADQKYQQAQSEANTAAKLAREAAELARQIVPAGGGSEGGSSDSGSGAGTGAGAFTLPSGITVFPMVASTDGAGVLGARTGRSSRGVAGVRVEDNGDGDAAADNTNGAVADNADKKDAATDDKSANDKNAPKQLKKVDDPATPLAAVPAELTEAESLWMFLALLAAIIAAGFTTYQIYRKKVAKPVDKDK